MSLKELKEGSGDETSAVEELKVCSFDHKKGLPWSSPF